MNNRMEAAKYALELSYHLIDHYDNKTNQQLMIAGFDSALLCMLITGMFTTARCGQITKIVIIAMCVISFGFLITALVLTRLALMPHVKHVKGTKARPGMLYFMDVRNNFGEEEFVKMFLGNDAVTRSKYYSAEDNEAFKKSFIEDCARDVYAHALILDKKTRYVKLSFLWTLITTISCIVTVSTSSILWLLGV